jgi:hypothetical protein
VCLLFTLSISLCPLCIRPLPHRRCASISQPVPRRYRVSAAAAVHPSVHLLLQLRAFTHVDIDMYPVMWRRRPIPLSDAKIDSAAGTKQRRHRRRRHQLPPQSVRPVPPRRRHDCMRLCILHNRLCRPLASGGFPASPRGRCGPRGCPRPEQPFRRRNSARLANWPETIRSDGGDKTVSCGPHAVGRSGHRASQRHRESGNRPTATCS